MRIRPPEISTRQLAFVLFVFSSVLFVQMIKISRPYSGHFSSYQANGNASIARNMLKENFSECHLPKTDILIGGKKSLHLNAYPMPALLAALGVRLWGGSLEFWGRFQAVLFNLMTIILVGLIAAHWFNSFTGWTAFLIYAFSPFSILYGQGFFSEPCAVFFTLLSIFLITKNDKENSLLRISLAGFCFSVGILARIHFVLLLPAFLLHVGWNKESRGLKLILFTVLTVVIPLTWFSYTLWASVNASNVHTNLFAQLATRVLQDKPLLLSLSYYLKIFDIVSGHMLTPLVFPLFILGVYLAKEAGKSFWVALSYLLSGFLIAILSPQKVMEQDFYLALGLPFLSIFGAVGSAAIWQTFGLKRNVKFTFFILFFYFLVSSRYFLNPIFKGSENINTILEAAAVVQRETDPNDFLIVAGNDTNLLGYYIDRPYWPLNFNLIDKPLLLYHKMFRYMGNSPAEVDELEKARKDVLSWFELLRKKGARYLVSTPKKELEANPTLLDYLNQSAERISKEGDFFLFRLKS